ncbi:MAG: response regulator [Nitrospirae bacterium]|nr:response regulator [Nitrospirota bacterium]
MFAMKASGSPHTILILDDDPDLCYLIQRLLHRESIDSIVATTGEEALEQLSSQPITLMLLDLHLPDMQGEELIRAIKTQHPTIPFIVVTGLGDELLAVKMLKSGARDYITKDERALELLPSIVLHNIQQLEQEHRLAHAEEELAAEQERSLVTLACIADGVITTDINGIVHSINPVALNLIGHELTHVLGRPIDQVFHLVQDHSEQEEHLVTQVLAQGKIIKPLHYRRLKNQSGSDTMVMCNASPICHHDGTVLGAVIVIRDMSDRLKIEQELQKASKLESVGTLAGGIAHDFNNLLLSIMGNISLAKLSLAPETRAFSQLLEAEKASLLAKGLTQQLLTFAKGGQPVKKPVRLVPILENATQLILRGERIQSEYRFPNELWDLFADESQLNQAFHNLILNAQQAMPQGGILHIEAENLSPHELPEKPGLHLENKPHVRIQIRDTGCGIPSEHLARVFDPYFTTKSHGSGLGLATTYSIITSHNGQMEVTSSPGEGTAFTMYLPASSVQALPRPPQPSNLRLGHGKILVMDDEEAIRLLLDQMLTLLGYTVELAANGDEAIERFAKAQSLCQPFCAVILDLTIPGGLGGKDTIQRLRLLDPKVQAIVSSGYSNDPVLSNYLAYGFQGMVAKPFRLDELSEAVYQVLAGRDA